MRIIMKRVAFSLIVVVAVASVIAFKTHAFRPALQEPAPVFVTEKPAGYREWRFISVAHEEGNLNSFARLDLWALNT